MTNRVWVLGDAVVDLVPDGSVRAFGFVTCERFDDPQLNGFVSVYLPQSYNIAGNMLLVRRDRIHPLDAEAGAFMGFIVSGGVADMPAGGTVVMDLNQLRGQTPSESNSRKSGS